jgi:uncharacterized PurR-regulated membrane protein YhhQ (DUF165 family)
VNKLQSLLWKLFGVSLPAGFAVGIILGILWDSAAFIYAFAQHVLAVWLGICGAVAFTVPIQLYVEYRMSRKKEKRNVVK